jgi:hypothetical protein
MEISDPRIKAPLSAISLLGCGIMVSGSFSLGEVHAMDSRTIARMKYCFIVSKNKKGSRLIDFLSHKKH